jgi:hypothetical protein
LRQKETKGQAFYSEVVRGDSVCELFRDLLPQSISLLLAKKGKQNGQAYMEVVTAILNSEYIHFGWLRQ